MKQTAIIVIILWICAAKSVAQHSAQLPSASVIGQTLDRVAQWQIDNFTYLPAGSPGQLHDYGIDAWTNAVFFIGLSEWSNVAANPLPYRQWLMETGEKCRWKLPMNFAAYPHIAIYHADELCIGQFFMAMYRGDEGQPVMIDDTRARLDSIMTHPPKNDPSHRNKQAWTWCDALFMAAPLYAQMAKTTGDDKYLRFMDSQFGLTYNHLYNRDDSLFFRDDSYFGLSEANGKPVYWGRGNGWVAAALVNLLKQLPPDSTYRAFYEELFIQLCTKLTTLQSPNGCWHASLLDPDTYPAPESSATALILYALAYGVNEGLLDSGRFRPAILKAWQALAGVIDETGKLGYVQPIGANPKTVTRKQTAVYGPGALLLAGVELIRMAAPI